MKSGDKNLSFSKSNDHGNCFKNFSAFDTKSLNFFDLSLSVTATHPS